MTKKDQVAEHMTQDGSFHLGLDNELYSKSLQGVFDNALFENLFAKIPKKKIGIFGSRKGTGAYIRKALGDRFAGYINSDTISDKCATMFDSVVIATGPDHYNQVKKQLHTFFRISQYIRYLAQKRRTTRKKLPQLLILQIRALHAITKNFSFVSVETFSRVVSNGRVPN